ncbi:uncharacterized protein LOC144440479 [Glandiceps talaboti]
MDFTRLLKYTIVIMTFVCRCMTVPITQMITHYIHRGEKLNMTFDMDLDFDVTRQQYDIWVTVFNSDRTDAMCEVKSWMDPPCLGNYCISRKFLQTRNAMSVTFTINKVSKNDSREYTADIIITERSQIQGKAKKYKHQETVKFAVKVLRSRNIKCNSRKSKPRKLKGKTRRS